jgi:hypothetical protein
VVGGAKALSEFDGQSSDPCAEKVYFFGAFPSSSSIFQHQFQILHLNAIENRGS